MSTPISDKQNLQISSKRINALIKTEDVFVSYQNDPKPGKRKTLSKLSIVPNGSRFLFHYRGDRLKIPKYQNTYRLEPFRFFHVETVDDIVRNILENKLSSVLIYHPDNASKLSMEIANDVLRAINRREYDRYSSELSGHDMLDWRIMETRLMLRAKRERTDLYYAKNDNESTKATQRLLVHSFFFLLSLDT